MVMKPYFWPRGAYNKLRTISTFAVMAGSKVCGIYAPLHWAGRPDTHRRKEGALLRARDVHRSLVWRAGPKAAAEYHISRRQAAGICGNCREYVSASPLLVARLAPKKKMGAVLRIMDRGILSANSVMNYQFLYLFPSIVQVFVTFFIFFTPNSSRLSCLQLLFLSPVAYCVATILLTQWRKKSRKATNRSDNKYHDLATDSLVNFETVKYFCERGVRD